MMPTLILDTSVLIAGLRSSLGASYTLLGLIGFEHFSVGLTAALVLEYEAVCMRSLDELGLTAEDVMVLLDYFCRVGKLAAVRFQVRPSVADPDDELVLEAAIASESEWIVSHNIRDMAVGAARYGIEVIRPGEALRRLGVE
ncbi:MAG: putative toxin-antitoxin system toxin component, PIN family [Gemmataceae bacterium]